MPEEGFKEFQRDSLCLTRAASQPVRAGKKKTHHANREGVAIVSVSDIYGNVFSQDMMESPMSDAKMQENELQQDH